MTASLVIFEDHLWRNFLPLTYTRAVFKLLCGTGSLLAKVKRLSGGAPAGAWCRPSLADVAAEQTLLPINEERAAPTLFLNGRGAWKRLPPARPVDVPWVGVIGSDPGIACIAADGPLAAHLSPEVLLHEPALSRLLSGLPRCDVSACVDLFQWPWELVLANESWLREDYAAHGWGGTIEGHVSPGVTLLNQDAIYIGPETRIKPSVVIDAEEGPVWVGRNVTIMPHCYLQGPAFIGNGSLLQPGTAVHAGTSIGPTCKIGGEIKASILQGYSNKQHDGFLGHSYIGSWVNIAADCLNSDLKNTYGTIRVPINGREVETGEMFVGMVVGDYTKTGINVSFPTGAVVGFCCNVLALRSPKFVPSFTWIDDETSEHFDEERGLANARKVMARRNHEMTSAEERAFLAVCPQALAIERDPQTTLAPRFTVEMPHILEVACR